MKNFVAAALLISVVSCSVPDSRFNPDLPISSECEPPVVEEISFEGEAVRVSRRRCIDKMGPDERGYYEFYYDFEDFEFSLGPLTLFGRAYAHDREGADFRGVRIGSESRFLQVGDLQGVLGRAAIHYFRGHGKTQLVWLDPSNELNGYSPIP
jgi:hypothetical protein